MKIIGIVGSRRHNTKEDRLNVEARFWLTHEEGDWICSGGCKEGADSFADKIARKTGIPILTLYANWNKFGKAAGPIRNKKIAEQSDVLIACVAEDRKGGTESTIEAFIKFRKEKHLFLIEGAK